MLVLKADNPKDLPNKLGVVIRLAGSNQLLLLALSSTPTINPPQYKVYTMGLIKDVQISELIAIIKE